MPVSERVRVERQARHDRRIADAAKVVPQGMSCYERIDGTSIVPCRYWKARGDWRDQAFGYCRLLKKGDNGKRGHDTFLLWDQCKECGINDDVEPSGMGSEGAAS